MQQAIKVSMDGSTAYTTSADFCRIFSEDMNSLYLLSFLLTADDEKAEQCFVAGLADSVEGNAVFKEWAYSWARRTIVQNAIRMIEPAQGKLTIAGTEPGRLEIEPRLEAILKLNALERFVFVMSVLERYSDQDCSILLGCPRQTIVKARARALNHLANATEIGSLPGEALQSTFAVASS